MKSRSLKSRLLAFLLVVCMVVGLTPVYAVSVGTSVGTLQINGSSTYPDVHVTFTPTETGHYFLVNHPEFPTLEACGDHGTVPSSFDFDDDEGWGFVYELTAGQTYCFKVQTENAYTVNVKKVSVAQSFDIPATLTGYAGTTISMPIDFSDALSTEVACDNPSVVELRGGNAHEEELNLLAPGTATITVTSHTGITKTCVVTVTPAPVNVCIEANGVEFRVNVTGTESGWETGSCTGSMSTHIEPGKTLTDIGVEVYHDAVHTQYLEGWQVNIFGIDADGNPAMMPKTDANGNEIRLTTAELLAYAIVEETVFVPLWNPSKYTSLYWMTIHGNGGTFERTIQDSMNTEVRQAGYFSCPTNDPISSLNDIGFVNLTDPVCAGKEFEGWVAYFHGPTDTAFSNPVDGIVLTTAQVLNYASQGVGYTDLIAKWKNEAIDPNNCPINDTDILISLTPVGPTVNPTNNLIISSNNGSSFTLHAADGSSETVNGWFEDNLDTAVGNTLADHGLTSIDLDTTTRFACWSVYIPVRDANNDIIDWEYATDANNDPIVLENVNDIFTYPIGDGVKFEAEWDLGLGQNGHQVEIMSSGVPYMHSVPDENGNIVTGEIGNSFGTTIESGTTLSDAGISVWQYPENDPYFEGWYVYHQDSAGYWVEDKDSNGKFILLDTATMLSTPITEDVRFKASWQTYSVIFEDVDGGTFDQVDPYSGSVFSDDCSKAGYYVSYMLNLEEIGCITDIKNGTETFYGWDVYEQVEDPNAPGSYLLNPLEGPISTQEALSRLVTYDVVYRANWTGISITPPALPTNLIISSNNGSSFTLHTADGSSETVNGWFEGYIDTAEGNTLGDQGLTAIDLDTSTPFACWSVFRPVFDSDGNIVDWENEKDEYGNDRILPDVNLILTWPINDGVKFVAEWIAGGNSGGVPGTPGQPSAGLAVSGNDGSFDVVRTNSQGQTEIWTEVMHTREDMDVFIGDTLADFGITDITNFKFWDGKREFVGWQAYGTFTVTTENGSYEEWGPLSDKIYTTKEVLAYPAEENFIEFVAVWAGDDADYYTEIFFDAVGGEFPVTEYDYTENGPVVIGTQFIECVGGVCREDDQPYAEQWDAACYPNANPVREGYTFEGWLIHSNEAYCHEMSDKLYTTEQILALPIPEDNTVYLAKWKEISMDEYRFGDPYYPSDGRYAQHYTMANGSELKITVTYDGGVDTFTDTYLTHHGEKTMSFEEYTAQYSGIKFDYELVDAANLEGWTTYQADKIFMVSLAKGEKLNLPDSNYTALYAAEEAWLAEDDEFIYTDLYLVLKNAKVYSTTMTPEEVLKLTADKFYVTIAQWHEASSTLANVKAATCTAEGYTGDTVCAKCGEILKKGETIPKAAHEISSSLANVKTATCAAEGYTGDKVCAQCNVVLVKGTAVAKLAHTASPNRVNVKSATHTETGYTGDVVCANCEEVLEAGQILDIVKETVATPVVKEEAKVSVDSQIKDVVAVISGEKAEETKTVLSEGTKEAIDEAVTAGHVVGADIVIEQISEESLSGEALETFKKEVAAIEVKAAEEIGDHAVVAEFIDISVIVKNRTTGEELGNITELDKPVTIEILVPAALQAENREYYIVHYHDGKAELIKGDYKDGVLSISADRFSTYALAYADVTEAPDPIVPATGDHSQLMLFTMLLLISAAGIYLASRKLRRA